MLRVVRSALAALAVLAVAAGPASASTASEVRAGQNVLQQLRSGATTCGDLAAADFEHAGEAAMQQALGSASAHEAMNARMTAVMGADATERMHELLGRQATGCASGSAGTAMGPGMMGAGWMRSADWSWMSGGRWQHMTNGDWQALRSRMMGSGSSSHHGGDAWTVVLVVAVSLGLVGLGAALAVGLRRRPTPPPVGS